MQSLASFAFLWLPLSLLLTACQSTKCDDPLPSGAVSYRGGDGSSINKAILVRARGLRDHQLAVYAYMNGHYGCMSTYRSIERYLTPTPDSYCDMYEFVTHDGKKHVLYFRGRKTSEAKASNQAMQLAVPMSSS